MMKKRSTTVFVVFVLAIIAFCLASVCAYYTGTYSFNPFKDDNSTNILNNTTTSTPDVDNGSSYIEVQNSDRGSDYAKAEDTYVSNSESNVIDQEQSSSSSEYPQPEEVYNSLILI